MFTFIIKNVLRLFVLTFSMNAFSNLPNENIRINCDFGLFNFYKNQTKVSVNEYELQKSDYFINNKNIYWTFISYSGVSIYRLNLETNDLMFKNIPFDRLENISPFILKGTCDNQFYPFNPLI